ncbi:hypothetical protein BGZ82_006059 [Podila clonocystis]|nr:hypothetical protein BGZ82_006059 [Podila clonocystis]
MMASPTSAKPPTKERPKELILRPRTEADKEQVVDQYMSTFRREPMGKLLGLVRSRGEYVMGMSLQDPVSYVIEDPRRPAGSEIIAFRASKLVTAVEVEYFINKSKITAAGTSSTTSPSPREAIVDHVLASWYRKTTIFKDKLGAKVMFFLALGCDENYEGMGLAKELLQVSMDRAREMQCDAAMVIATATATQHLYCTRFGFDRVVQVQYNTFEMPTAAAAAAADVESGSGDDERTFFPFKDITEPPFIEVYEKKLN